METDLFGQALPPVSVLRKDGKRKKTGYAAKPGSGPKRQRCLTCASAMRVLARGVRSLKCELMSGGWTHGSETDIHPNAPACSSWSRRQYKSMALTT